MYKACNPHAMPAVRDRAFNEPYAAVEMLVSTPAKPIPEAMVECCKRAYEKMGAK